MLLQLLVCAPLRAQQAASSPARISPSSAAPAAPPPATASLEERIAAARSVKVMTSILGIELGSDLDEAHEKLDRLCIPGTHPKEEGGKDEEKEREEKAHHSGGEKEEANEESRRAEQEPRLGEEKEEGYKVLWRLADPDYSAIFITADDKEHINSITGILRPDKQMLFDHIGEVSKAPLKDNDSVVWDVLRPGHPLFRVVARGADGKAGTIRLFVVHGKTGGVVRYNGTAADDSH